MQSRISIAFDSWQGLQAPADAPRRRVYRTVSLCTSRPDGATPRSVDQRRRRRQAQPFRRIYNHCYSKRFSETSVVVGSHHCWANYKRHRVYRETGYIAVTQTALTELVDWVKVLRPTRHKMGHFANVLPSGVDKWVVSSSQMPSTSVRGGAIWWTLAKHKTGTV